MLKSKTVIAASVLIIFALVLQAVPLVGEEHHSTSFIENSSSSPSGLSQFHNSLLNSSVQNPGNGSTGASYRTQPSLIHNVPSRYVYLPSNQTSLVKDGSVYVPGYTTSPAPMGIADYGVTNKSGTLSGYSYRTTSFQGTITVDNMTPLYVLNDAPRSLSIQLNAILANVSVGSAQNNVYWTQNVLYYSAGEHQIQFIDNVWNFSDANAGIYNSTILAHGDNGTVVPGSFYYALGPKVSVTYPFSVSLYLNSTLYGGSDKVFFNYSISEGAKGGKQMHGTYDYVVFNSTAAQPSPAEYYVSGTSTTPLGYIPYDAEFAIGGPGGGSTTSLYGIDATMSLKYLPGGSNTYSNVKSAYDAGSATGETANGISVAWNSNDQATLKSGPSFVYGMWGISGSKMVAYSGSIKPAESFLLISNSTRFSNSSSSWAPLTKGGLYSFSLPGGEPYSFAALSNWHNPEYGSLLPGNSALLPVQNRSEGIYTPVYIFGNSQAANLSASGSGTALSPYIITGTQNSSIMPAFGKFNDFAFPVFPGLLVSGVSGHVQFVSLPSFHILYSQSQDLFLSSIGLPPVNYLNLEFYNDSNITLAQSSFISGWFSSDLAGFFPAANVVFWNTTNSLIASNYFSSMDSSLLIYNHNSTDANNTVWGNSFQEDTLSFSSYFNRINTVGAPAGLSMFSSGNTVYNNIFNVYFTAVSPNISIYSGVKVSYSNTWNISKEPVSFYRYVLGMNLTGGIMSSGPNGITYQGGNYWWNYLGNGSQMYNDSGFIGNGGDMVPLVKKAFSISFSQSGLPGGKAWYVIINNGSIGVRGTGPVIQFYEPNGTYFIQVYAQGYAPNLTAGFIVVVGKGQAFSLLFMKEYLLKFNQSGIPPGKQWSVTVNGVTGTSSNSTVEFLATNGTFSYTVGKVSGYIPFVGGGSFEILGSNTHISVVFRQYSFPVTVLETGLQSGTRWGIFTNGADAMTTGNSIKLNLPNGTYDYTVLGAKGYSVNSPRGTFSVNNGSYQTELVFGPHNFTVTFSENGLPAGKAWSVSINGKTFSTSNGSITMEEQSGSYGYSIEAPRGYVVSAPSGTVDVSGNMSVPLTFSPSTLSVFQIMDYALFAASVLILAYTYFRARKG